jgi:hypothetical protein
MAGALVINTGLQSGVHHAKRFQPFQRLRSVRVRK